MHEISTDVLCTAYCIVYNKSLGRDHIMVPKAAAYERHRELQY